MFIPENVCFFCQPFSMIVAGPSGSGKTEFVKKLLKNHSLLLFPKLNSPKARVLWAHGQWQVSHRNESDSMKIEFVEGLPSENEIKQMRPDFLIIDDLMNETANETALGNLFTKGSHHLNLNVIFITQNLFHKGTQMRNINLSANYIVLMGNKRDPSQIDCLGRQLKIQKYLQEAFFDATSKPFGYLILDFKPSTPRELMLRTRIFPDENNKGVFKPVFYLIK